MNIRFCFLYYVVTCLLICLVAGCGSDEEELTNSSPVVSEFIVPGEFNPGDKLEFKVIAIDKDGDSLTYDWSVDAGKLNTTTGRIVIWTAPPDVETVKVTVIVSDGVTKSIKRVKKLTNLSLLPHINLIEPGRSAAGIRLGAHFKTVEDLYGKADDPLGVDRHFSYWDRNLGLSGFVDENNRVRSGHLPPFFHERFCVGCLVKEMLEK